MSSFELSPSSNNSQIDLCSCSVNRTGRADDRVPCLEQALSQTKQSLKAKESVVRMQKHQLKKLEEMYKKCLEENETLSYMNKKTMDDLENLKIINKQYEGKIVNTSNHGTPNRSQTGSRNGINTVLTEEDECYCNPSSVKDEGSAHTSNGSPSIVNNLSSRVISNANSPSNTSKDKAANGSIGNNSNNGDAQSNSKESSNKDLCGCPFPIVDNIPNRLNSGSCNKADDPNKNSKADTIGSPKASSKGSKNTDLCDSPYKNSQMYVDSKTNTETNMDSGEYRKSSTDDLCGCPLPELDNRANRMNKTEDPNEKSKTNTTGSPKASCKVSENSDTPYKVSRMYVDSKTNTEANMHSGENRKSSTVGSANTNSNKSPKSNSKGSVNNNEIICECAMISTANFNTTEDAIFEEDEKLNNNGTPKGTASGINDENKNSNGDNKHSDVNSITSSKLAIKTTNKKSSKIGSEHINSKGSSKSNSKTSDDVELCGCPRLRKLRSSSRNSKGNANSNSIANVDCEHINSNSNSSSNSNSTNSNSHTKDEEGSLSRSSKGRSHINSNTDANSITNTGVISNEDDNSCDCSVEEIKGTNDNNSDNRKSDTSKNDVARAIDDQISVEIVIGRQSPKSNSKSSTNDDVNLCECSRLRKEGSVDASSQGSGNKTSKNSSPTRSTGSQQLSNKINGSKKSSVNLSSRESTTTSQIVKNYCECSQTKNIVVSNQEIGTENNNADSEIKSNSSKSKTESSKSNSSGGGSQTSGKETTAPENCGCPNISCQKNRASGSLKLNSHDSADSVAKSPKKSPNSSNNGSIINNKSNSSKSSGNQISNGSSKVDNRKQCACETIHESNDENNDSNIEGTPESKSHESADPSNIDTLNANDKGSQGLSQDSPKDRSKGSMEIISSGNPKSNSNNTVNKESSKFNDVSNVSSETKKRCVCKTKKRIEIKNSNSTGSADKDNIGIISSNEGSVDGSKPGSTKSSSIGGADNDINDMNINRESIKSNSTEDADKEKQKMNSSVEGSRKSSSNGGTSSKLEKNTISDKYIHVDNDNKSVDKVKCRICSSKKHQHVGNPELNPDNNSNASVHRGSIDTPKSNVSKSPKASTDGSSKLTDSLIVNNGGNTAATSNKLNPDRKRCVCSIGSTNISVHSKSVDGELASMKSDAAGSLTSNSIQNANTGNTHSSQISTSIGSKESCNCTTMKAGLAANITCVKSIKLVLESQNAKLETILNLLVQGENRNFGELKDEIQALKDILERFQQSSADNIKCTHLEEINTTLQVEISDIRDQLHKTQNGITELGLILINDITKQSTDIAENIKKRLSYGHGHEFPTIKNAQYLSYKIGMFLTEVGALETINPKNNPDAMKDVKSGLLLDGKLNVFSLESKIIELKKAGDEILAEVKIHNNDLEEIKTCLTKKAEQLKSKVTSIEMTQKDKNENEGKPNSKVIIAETTNTYIDHNEHTPGEAVHEPSFEDDGSRPLIAADKPNAQLPCKTCLKKEQQYILEIERLKNESFKKMPEPENSTNYDCSSTDSSKEIETLKRQLRELQLELDEYTADVGRKSEKSLCDIKEKDLEIEHLNIELNLLNDEYKKVCEDYAKLQEEFDKAQLEIEQLNKEIMEFSDKHKEKDTAICKFKDTFKDLTEELKNVMATKCACEELRTILKQNEEKMLELQKVNDHLETNLQELKGKLSKANESNGYYNEKLEEALCECDKYKSQLHEAKTSNAKLKLACSKLEEVADQHRKAKESYKREFCEFVKNSPKISHSKLSNNASNNKIGCKRIYNKLLLDTVCCEKTIKNDAPQPELERVLAECEEYKNKLDKISLKIQRHAKEHAVYRQEAEFKIKKLNSENDKFKKKLMDEACPIIVGMKCCDNLNIQVCELRAFIAASDAHLEQILTAKHKAQQILSKMNYDNSSVCQYVCNYDTSTIGTTTAKRESLNDNATDLKLSLQIDKSSENTPLNFPSTQMLMTNISSLENPFVGDAVTMTEEIDEIKEFLKCVKCSKPCSDKTQCISKAKGSDKATDNE